MLNVVLVWIYFSIEWSMQLQGNPAYQYVSMGMHCSISTFRQKDYYGDNESTCYPPSDKKRTKMRVMRVHGLIGRPGGRHYRAWSIWNIDGMSVYIYSAKSDIPFLI
jgi:hypothetical protein